MASVLILEVKLDLSPALNESNLELNYNKEVLRLELDEVVRQGEDSSLDRDLVLKKKPPWHAF